jgi:phospholipid/cholesterol/gamma-HCH transport system ATP-binding protein
MIQFIDFYKSFGSKKVHQGVSFTVNSGECLGLIGGSGTGKSVLLRSIIGLEKPDSGQILVNKQPVNNMNDFELTSLRKKVAYVFQNGALFDSMNVYENLAYPLREHTRFSRDQIKVRITQILEEFGLSGNENIYPDQLSGGMQKRLGMARSIIIEPEVMLYDEPTAGLDPFNTKRIQEMILQMKHKGKTSILVTHDMPVALEVCDRLALLLNGRIHEITTPKDFYASENSLMKKFIQGETA